MDEQIALKNLDVLGQQYCDNLLDEKTLEHDWWKSLDFFFDHAFNRGRRDELSLKYKTFTLEVLKKRYEIEKRNLPYSYDRLINDYKQGYFNKNIIFSLKEKYKIDKKKNSVKNENFCSDISEINPLIKSLIEKLRIAIDYTSFGGKIKQEEVYLGNEKDIIMVLDTLKFITDNNKMNIYQYLRDNIVTHGVQDTFNFLTNEETGITQIADKLGTFVIRDIILMNPKITYGTKVNYEFTFPVDTWVRQIYVKMAKPQQGFSDVDVKRYFIEKCEKHGYFPPKIAAGLWFLSFRSLDLLISNLDRIIIDDVK